MPIFAYECRSCGHRFDALQKLNAAAMRDCPECGAPELRKLLSAPHVHGRRKAEEKGPPKKKPRLMHALDSPTPHADHHSHGHDHSHDHKHDHGHGNKHKHGHDH
jgi:putative FmdB family regulatory protein